MISEVIRELHTRQQHTSSACSRRNHAFVDGNKRTAFVVGVLFFEINAHRFAATEEDSTQAILGLADSTIDEA